MLTLKKYDLQPYVQVIPFKGLKIISVSNSKTCISDHMKIERKVLGIFCFQDLILSSRCKLEKY